MANLDTVANVSSTVDEAAVETEAGPRVNGAALESFKTALRGQLLAPEDEGYDEVRKVWNGTINRRPALIARCSGPADVITAVNFARTHDLLVSVRGGGHSFAGNAVCDGGLMIDLSQMKSVRVDPGRETARAEPGVLLGELDHETQAFGLATPAGVVSHTGIAGLTLGGGQGWLMGKHGLTIDNLLSVDMVTADGQFLTVSENEHPDLFWAVRGAGANFGIVTSFQYRLHPQNPAILAGMVLYPMEQAYDVLRFYREYSMNTADDLMTIAALLSLPDGTPAVALVVAWLGPLAEGEMRLKPLRTFGTPLADMVGETTYCELQRLFDAAVPHGMHRYLKMGYVTQIEDDLIAVIIDYMSRKTSPYSVALFNVMKGAVCRVASDATAFPHRDPQWHFDFAAQWTDPAEADGHMEWVRDFWGDAKMFTRGAAANFLDVDDGMDRMRSAYGANYDRLLSLKRKYDPSNFFRLNTNIAP